MAKTLVKTTQDGRKVEVIGLAICLEGELEAFELVEVKLHPNRRKIWEAAPDATHMAGRITLTKDEAAIVEGAFAAAQAEILATPAAINERFRIAGRLVDDTELADTLAEIERVNAGAPITIFEVLTAVWLLLFSRHPAELAVVEVGLGGRYDATNLLDRPAACAIASISMDHEAFLGDSLAGIAGEKAGIIKPGVPVVTGRQAREVIEVIEAEARAKDATLWLRDRDWWIEPAGDRLAYRDRHGSLDLPLPSLPGAHQIDNTGLAVAALRAALHAGDGLPVLPGRAWEGIARIDWPGRLQRLHGALAARLPPGWELWLDGGHNPGAGLALADTLAGWSDRPLHLLVGMKQSKNAAGFLTPLLAHVRSVWAVAEPDQHLALPVAEIVAASGGIAQPGPTVADALAKLSGEAPASPAARVLVCGSLYLAGEVLKADGSLPR